MRASLRRREASCGCAAGVAAGRAASRGVRCRSEFCWVPDLRVIGFPAAASTLAVSGGAHAALLPAPSPALFRRRVHPLFGFTPLQSTSASTPALACRPRHLPWDSRPLCAASDSGVLAAGVQPRRPSVLGVSHALDDFDSDSRPDGLRACPTPRGFVSPRNHVQGSPFRGSFLQRRRAGSSPADALSALVSLDCRLPRRGLSSRFRSHRLHLATPRPQGFDRCWSPRSMTRFYPHQRSDPLLGFASSRFSVSVPRENE